MASGSFSEMNMDWCEFGNLIADERPLIQFVPTEPLNRDHVNRLIYMLLEKKDSTFEVQLFNKTGACEDLIHWLYSVKKYFSFSSVTDAAKKLKTIPGFLANHRTVYNLWEKCKKGVAQVETAKSRPNYFCAFGLASDQALN